MAVAIMVVVLIIFTALWNVPEEHIYHEHEGLDPHIWDDLDEPQEEVH